ncbi:MAG: hypothetical protein WAM43_07200 [Terriglobales bacterium]
MKRLDFHFSGRSIPAGLCAFLIGFLSAAAPNSTGQINAPASAQGSRYERTYRQSKSAVEKALKELQPSMGGRLPVLDGFAVSGDHPLSRYQRAYFQSSVEVVSTPSGGSVVRVSTKVTAWYTDPTPSRSGYQLLTSNGRIESDLLDQLNDLLATRPGAVSADKNAGESFPANAPPAAWAKPPAGASKVVAGHGVASQNIAKPGAETPTSASSGTSEPAISAPLPRPTDNTKSLSSSLQPGLTAQQLADSKNSQKPDLATTSLQAQAASLEEVLKNQAHPRNLVAIKKSGTPVVSTPSLSGKTLFLASAQDEFEMLDFNADWVHVRISGLSRGWIWRTSLEMPEGISDIPLNRGNAAPVAADLFQVTREETGPFPGDWEPLRGRSVRIISVQKIQENEKDSGAQAKLEFAKSLLDKNYAELAAKPQEFAGVVLIFDSVDGGMIAATLPTVQQWKAGTLSDAALWHRCYFDPPETFNVSSPGGGQ